MTIRLSLVRFALIFFVVLIIVLLGFAKIADAQEIMPLSAIKPGMKGYGLTVFKGKEREKFNFEVVGVYNSFPKYIVVYLSGGPKGRNGREILTNANVAAGMSGSPLYVDDKIIGSIALVPTFSKEPYTFVTPIESTLGFVTNTMKLPNKFITGHFHWPGFTEYIKPGETYVFCEVWGDNYVCGGGTVTMANPRDPEFLHLLGHSGHAYTGVFALPFWRSEVLDIVPTLNSSFKIIQERELGPMLGSVIFNGPFGQIAQLGTVPKSIPVKIVLENSAPQKIEKTLFLAYTHNIPTYVAGSLLSTRGLTDGLLDLDANARLNIAGLGEVRWTGLINFESALRAGQLVKLFLTDELNPVVDEINIAVKARPKYKALKFSEVTVEIRPTDTANKKTPIIRPVELNLSISAVGDGNWSKSVEIKLDDKYRDKKLYLADGETLLSEVLSSLEPNKAAIEFLNKISKRSALYLYYKKEAVESSKKQESRESAAVTTPRSSSSNPNTIFVNADGQKAAENKKDGAKSVALAADVAWVQKPADLDTEILAVIDLPSEIYLIRGKEEVSVQTANSAKSKKKKRFFVF